MRMDFSLVLQQTQKLIMTPELKQAIEILQFSSQELSDFISEELLNNPVLERPESASGADPLAGIEPMPGAANAEPSSGSAAEIGADTGGEIGMSLGDVQPIAEGILLSHEDIRRMLQTDYQRYSGYSLAESEADNLDSAAEPDLKSHLIEQLAFVRIDPRLHDPMMFLIESVDDSGYLGCTLADLRAAFRLSADEANMLLHLLQSFDPVGVGARDLRECLLLQLKALGHADSLASTLVRDHLDSLADNKIIAVAKQLYIQPEAIQRAFDLIRSLEPRPGASYTPARNIRYIRPDVTVERVRDEYVILVNESAAPKLVVSNYYRDLFKNIETDKITADYLARNLQSALKLIKAIEQRRSTIYKVCRSILEHQSEFFESGLMGLKPLTLRQVAEDIDMHESTVSRAVNGKYMQCPNGLFELRYFFQSGVSKLDGDGVSADTVKNMIREMIESENPKRPYSDQYIADQLCGRGISISRRTVAKYRDDSGIASSSRRKRY